jgi:hypothetical protein
MIIDVIIIKLDLNHIKNFKNVYIYTYKHFFNITIVESHICKHDFVFIIFFAISVLH